MSVKKRYGAAESALSRHETYQTGFKRMVYAVIAMAMVSTTSVGLAWWGLSSKPEPRYFATREDGGILPLTAVSQPMLSDSQISNFAVEAITRAMTMSFSNYRNDLAEASEYFVRPDGWNNYLTALQESGSLEFVQNRRLVSTAVANGATIVRSGVDSSGYYTWLVQVPMVVTYESSSETSKSNILAEILISRMPTWQMPRGVGIKQVVMRTGR